MDADDPILTLEQPSPIGQAVPSETCADAGPVEIAPPAPPSRGWAKNTESSKQHYYVAGRALCRLFYLQARYRVDPAPPSTDEQCRCCAREKAFLR